MKTEIEVKVLEIDVDMVILLLDKLGAERIGEKKQRRFVYDFTPKKENAWVRLRTNGSETTLTIKEIKNEDIDGTKEIEIIVGDFDKTNFLLEKLGYINKSYQENKRISYLLEGVEVEIDFWPRIPPYLEVEGKSVEEVKKIVTLLGFDFSKTTSVNTLGIYKKYGIDIEMIKELKF